MSWIKLHYSFLKWEWITVPETVSLFIHLLLMANYEDRYWHGILIPRGSLVTGRKRLAELTGLSEQQVRTNLKRLISTNQISVIATTKYSIITICGFDNYNGDERNAGATRENPGRIDRRATNGRQTSDKRATNEQHKLNTLATIKQPTDNHTYRSYRILE